MAERDDSRVNKNRTSKPYYFRPDIAEEQKDGMSDAYPAEENNLVAGSGRGAMPTEKYPSGSVKAKVWNKERPHRENRICVHTNRDVRNAVD